MVGSYGKGDFSLASCEWCIGLVKHSNQTRFVSSNITQSVMFPKPNRLWFTSSQTSSQKIPSTIGFQNHCSLHSTSRTDIVFLVRCRCSFCKRYGMSMELMSRWIVLHGNRTSFLVWFLQHWVVKQKLSLQLQGCVRMDFPYALDGSFVLEDVESCWIHSPS